MADYQTGLPDESTAQPKFQEAAYSGMYAGHLEMLCNLEATKSKGLTWIGKLQNHIGLSCKSVCYDCCAFFVADCFQRWMKTPAVNLKVVQMDCMTENINDNVSDYEDL